MHPVRRALGQKHRRPADRRRLRRLRVCGRDPRRRRGILARHDRIGSLGPHAVGAAQARLQARHAGREHVRDRFRGAAPGLLRGRVRRVRHRDGDRSREAEGLRLLGAGRFRYSQRRHARQHDGARDVLAARAGLLQEVRPRPREGKGRAFPYRVEEPSQRREESQGAVPEGGADRSDQELAQDRRSARHHGLLGRVGWIRGGDRGSRRGRAQVSQGPDLHQGAVVRRGTGRRARSRRTTTSRLSRRSWPAPKTHTARRESPTLASR